MAGKLELITTSNLTTTSLNNSFSHGSFNYSCLYNVIFSVRAVAAPPDSNKDPVVTFYTSRISAARLELDSGDLDRFAASQQEALLLTSYYLDSGVLNGIFLCLKDLRSKAYGLVWVQSHACSRHATTGSIAVSSINTPYVAARGRPRYFLCLSFSWRGFSFGRCQECYA